MKIHKEDVMRHGFGSQPMVNIEYVIKFKIFNKNFKIYTGILIKF